MRPRRPDSLAAEAAFRARLEELGATLLEPEWAGALHRHHIRCSRGHDCYLRPSDVRPGKGICRRCTSSRLNSPRAQRAEAEFRARLAELGATPLYGTWLGVGQPHRVRCASGHECHPRPSGLQQGEGICRTCARNDPSAAEAVFRERLAGMGARPLFQEWGGSDTPHHVLCSAGHDCYPRPGNVRSGWGICKTCAGKDPAVTESTFLARLAEMGCVPLYEKYQGRNKPHHVRCSAGHDCSPRPESVLRGSGVCRICARRDPGTAETAFRARLAELGAELLSPYTRSQDQHHVRCSAGHDCYPRPNDVQQGIGICRTCAGQDPVVAEMRFRKQLRMLGAVPVYTQWRGVNRPHHVRCIAGHDCYPHPSNVVSGQGICLPCAGQAHSVFYVLAHDMKPVVKFGISSHDGRARLRRHSAHGYTRVHRLITDLNEGVARRAEDAVRSAVALAGEKPVLGREYFDISCLALILDVADSWLAADDAPHASASIEVPQNWVQDMLFAA